MAPAAGERIGSYVLADLLGEGGMGRVYRASGAGGVDVALKLLREELARDPVYRRRFTREASLALKVRHGHVVATLDHGEVDGTLYLAQQFIPGDSVRAVLRRRGRLEIGETIRIAVEVAAGLGAVHGAGLVHRDVKPDNVMLDEQGRAYLADFGLAKDRAATTMLTKFGQAVGSVDYMAPEQIRGQGVDARADVYGLGCFVWECLCGSPPFAGREGVMQVMWAQLREAPGDLGAQRTDAPAELGWAVAKALEKEPADRPPTAMAYAHMLQAACMRTGSLRP